MSRIFLCHASEDKTIAKAIQLALVGAGHEVFYDERNLAPSSNYNDQIRTAIKKCDLFLFIASATSTTPGRFTLTELAFAEERWPSPVGRVLPVVVGNLSPKGLPAYLQATVVLRPAGNAAAEVLVAVETVLRQKRRGASSMARVALWALAVATAIVVVAIVMKPPEQIPEVHSTTVHSQQEVKWGEFEFCLRSANYPPKFGHASFNVAVGSQARNCTEVPWRKYEMCSAGGYYGFLVGPLDGSQESATLEFWRHEGPCPSGPRNVDSRCSDKVQKC